MTQQKQFAGTGDVSGQITGGARNGMNWDFMDQQGKVLTSVPYQDYVDNYQTNSGVVRQGINAVNGVQVYDFNNPARAQAAPASTGLVAAAQPAAAASAPANQGIVGGAINNVTTGQSAAAKSLAPFNPTSDMSIQTTTPQTREVNQATETAAGQVNSLLANDNPLLQRARTLARQGMAQRGLVNSSMAQGAGVAAMVDRITPIAQQDAQTYSQRALANMEATNEANQFNVNQNNQLLSQGLNIAANKDLAIAQQTFQSAQADLERAFQATQQDKSIKAQTDLQVAQQNFTKAQNDLDRAQQFTLTSAQLNSNERLTLAQIEATARNLNTSNQAQMDQLKTQITNSQTEGGKNYAATLTLNATNQINAILADGNLDAAAKQGAIDNLIKTTNTSLQWASTFYNTNLPSYTAPGGAGTVINPGAGAGTSFSSGVSKDAIKSYVQNVLEGSGTNAEKAAVINSAAASSNVTREQIASATGFPLTEVNAFLSQANTAAATTTAGAATTAAPAAATTTAAPVTTAATTTPATATTTATTPTVTTAAPTAATTTATPAPAAPSSAAIRDYVSNVLSSGGTAAQQAAAINQAAASSGVSREQIAAATGYSLAQVNAFLQ